MNRFFTLWRKECSAYFLSPIAYIMMVFFLISYGFFFWMLTAIVAQPGGGDTTVMAELFGGIFFWIEILIIIPIITMRLFSEEIRSGTFETLLTAPVSDLTIVLAKYAGALTMYVILFVPTLAYAFVIHRFSSLLTPIDLGPVWSAYVGAFLVGGFYLSIGLFVSSITRNQIVAAIITFAAVCMVMFAGFLPYIFKSDFVMLFYGYTSAIEHMADFARGAVDTRPMVLYVTASLFMLFMTVKSIEMRRWQ